MDAKTLLCTLAAAALHPASGTTIEVSGDRSSLREVIATCAAGDTLALDGSFRESLRIDAARLSRLTLVAAGDEPARWAPGEDGAGILEIDNRQALPFELSVSGIDFRGREDSSIGIHLLNAWTAGDAVESRISVNDCTFESLLVGIKAGVSAQTRGCDTRWNALDPARLAQAPSRILVRRCAFLGLGGNAIELHRSSGRIEHCLIARCGTEGVHVTEGQDLEIVHNVLLRSHRAQLHLQLPGAVRVHNNLFAGAFSIDHPIGLGRLGGHGLVLDGQRGSEATAIYNNLFLANDAAGLLVRPAELVAKERECRLVAALADVRNNIFHMNGRDPKHAQREAIHVQGSPRPEARIELRYNLIQHPSEPANVALDETNRTGLDPLFVDPRRGLVEADGLGGARSAWALALDGIDGFVLDDASPAVDGGDHDARLGDAGGPARGEGRADQGIFGGPSSDWWAAQRRQ